MNTQSFIRALAKGLHLVFIAALAMGLTVGVGPVRVARAAGPWYVAPGGSDSNSCLSAGSPCSTINGAIGKASSGDTIYVATGTYTNSTGSEVVLIDKSITLSGGWDVSFTTQGGMSTVDGEETRRGITVNSAVIATVGRFIIQNGSAPNFPGGGGVYNGGTLTITTSTIVSNTAYVGGGVRTETFAILAIANSTIISNTASNAGGGISSTGLMTVTDSTIMANMALAGGGIGGSGTIRNSAILSNTATSYGGGIWGGGAISSSVISGNSASQGGGIWNEGGTGISNSTLSGNKSSDSGGGIANIGGFGFVGLILDNVTLTNNTADNDNNGSGDGGGVFNISGSTVNIKNTILAGNIDMGGQAPDCAGPLTSQGHNLIQTTTGCTISGITTGNITGLSPSVGPLQDNGGSTLTHALLPGSPAIDAGNPAPPGSGGNACEATDQRGVARPQGTACDIGAFELEAVSQIIQVTIDIKPGKGPNRIEIEPDDDGKKKIQVAILSTAQFDAPQQVDKNSLTFGHSGDEDSLHHKGRKGTPDCRTRDVNHDRRSDLVCTFLTQATGFQFGDTVGILKGQTVEGVPIEGRDSVVIVVDD